MFQKIKAFFQKLFHSPTLQAFESWCAQVFTAEKVLLLNSIKAFAIDAVATAELTGLDNSSKRSMAFSEIAMKAQTAGLVVGASMVGLAIEMAVTGLKNGQANGSK